MDPCDGTIARESDCTLLPGHCIFVECGIDNFCSYESLLVVAEEIARQVLNEELDILCGDYVNASTKLSVLVIVAIGDRLGKNMKAAEQDVLCTVLSFPHYGHPISQFPNPQIT